LIAISPFLCVLASELNGLKDVDISGAAACVAGDGFANFFF
jgi:hypothetical protein